MLLTVLKCTLACALSALIPEALAQSSSPSRIVFHFLKATTPGERSALSGECDGTTASPEVTCRFTQVSVRYKLDSKDVSAELDRRLKEAREAAAGDSQGFEREIDKKMCAAIRKGAIEKQRELERMNALNRRRISEFLAFCSKPTLAAFEALMRKTVTEESRTCLVSSFQNDPITFKKVSSNKWIANVGPKGICDTVYLYEMEHMRESNLLWKWSQILTYTNKSKPFCKDMQLNEKLEFAWDGEDIPMQCEVISFGM